MKLIEDTIKDKAFTAGLCDATGTFYGTAEVIFVEDIDEAPAVVAVPLSEIYRAIAGHSDYHGNEILATLTCIAEGKTVKPATPLSVKPVTHEEL